MKSLTFTRGAVLTGALTLTHAATALAAGAVAGGAAMTPEQRHVEAVLAAFGQQTGAYGPTATAHASVRVTRAGGENTPLNLTASPRAHAAGGGSSLVRMIVALLIVIAVIYGVSWILRRFKGDRAARTRGSGLAAVASVPLGTGRSLQLVRAGQELVLLGVAEHGVTAIRRYTEDEARAAGFTLDENDDPVAEPGSVATADVRLQASVDRRAGLGRGSLTSAGRSLAGPGETALSRLLEALRRMTERS
jgi:flagellar protein FliO/FliZ